MKISLSIIEINLERSATNSRFQETNTLTASISICKLNLVRSMLSSILGQELRILE